MKTTITSILFLTALFSCSTDFENHAIKTEIPTMSNAHKITKEKAMYIAGKVLNGTRAESSYSVKYIMNKAQAKTRSGELPDTLAYILNRNENNGFVIVSTDDRVFPVLAFSDNGHFSYEENDNDVVYVSFISRLDEYMSAISENDTAVTVPDDCLSSCRIQYPQIGRDWSQESPFDKYVIMEHPGCPAGCVAVATGLIMAHQKDSFTYHDTDFNFAAMRGAMDGSSGEYSYDEAVDYIAKLLYLLGKDLNIRYSTGGSSAYSTDAVTLLNDLGFNVNSPTLINFDANKMIDAVMQDAILYVDGRLMSNISNGHAWVIDGGSFCWTDLEKTNKDPIFFHCNWGWGGNFNGYYSGSVLSVNDSEYGNMRYVSVRRKHFLTPNPYETYFQKKETE